MESDGRLWIPNEWTHWTDVDRMSLIFRFHHLIFSTMTAKNKKTRRRIKSNNISFRRNVKGCLVCFKFLGFPERWHPFCAIRRPESVGTYYGVILPEQYDLGVANKGSHPRNLLLLLHASDEIRFQQ